MTTTIITGKPGSGRTTYAVKKLENDPDKAMWVGSAFIFDKSPFAVLNTLLKAHNIGKTTVVFDEIPENKLDTLLLCLLNLPCIIDVLVITQADPFSLRRFEPFIQIVTI